MLGVDDLAFPKALASPAVREELRKAVAARKILRSPTVAVGRRGLVGPVSSHRSLHQSAAKRKATELYGPSNPMEPAARRPAPKPVEEQAASGGRQLGSPEGAAT